MRGAGPILPEEAARGAEREPVRAPLRGEHTAEVLETLCGYAPERVRELAAEGVFGDVR